ARGTEAQCRDPGPGGRRLACAGSGAHRRGTGGTAGRGVRIAHPVARGRTRRRVAGAARCRRAPGRRGGTPAGGAIAMSTRRDHDALVVGGGHNGLVCAAYLAATGLKVAVLERRGIVGGAAVTEEFHPGFRNSVASYTVSLLNPRVIRDLRLAEHGLRVVERPYSNFLPLPDGRAFRLGGEHGQADIAQWSRRDVERLPQYYAMLERVVVVLRELMDRTPPNVSDRFVLADWLSSYDVAKRLKHLDMRGRRDLLD